VAIERMGGKAVGEPIDARLLVQPALSPLFC